MLERERAPAVGGETGAKEGQQRFTQILRVPEEVTEVRPPRQIVEPFDATRAAFDYAYPWDGLIPALKFNDALAKVPFVVSLNDRLDETSA